MKKIYVCMVMFMKKSLFKIFVITLGIITLLNTTSITILASEIEETKEIQSIAESSGYLIANKSAIQTLQAEKKFSSRTGHGFAAERGNNLVDVYHGKNAMIVGDNNVKDGADRLIINRDGSEVWIQDKYYKSATESIEACFNKEDGMFRYLDADGKPMQIEVPSDQYDDAVLKMREKITKGKVKGITAPDDAQYLVKKGNLTYKQAVNITKAGNIDSLKYDAKNGIITASAAVGIAFMLDYAVALLNGYDGIEALEMATMTGLKTGSVVFCTYVISSQLTKSGLSSALTPTSIAVTRALGKDVARSILETNGIQAAGMSAGRQTLQVANIIKNQAVIGTVAVIVLSTGDVIEVFQGRISKEQMLSNIAVTIVSVGGGIAGGYAGGAIGSAIAPGIGTTVGSVVGGTIGSVGVGLGADYIAKLLYEGDAQMMYDIVVAEFQAMAEDYLVNEAEASNITNELSKRLSEDALKDMFESKDRVTFAKELMEPMFETEIAKRELVKTPSEDEIRAELKQNLIGVALIH